MTLQQQQQHPGHPEAEEICQKGFSSLSELNKEVVVKYGAFCNFSELRNPFAWAELWPCHPRPGQVSAMFQVRICLISSILNAQEEEEAPLLWSTQEREQQSGLSLLQQPVTKPQKEPNDNKYNKKHNTETHCGPYRKKKYLKC